MRGRWRALVLVGIAAAPAAAATKAPATKCVQTGAIPSSDARLRPTPILTCDYAAEELGDRLLTLLARGLPPPTIATVEQRLSLPRLATVFDAVRSANYSVELRGPGDGWQIQLSIDESFFPTDATARPRFRGSGRPSLIDPRIRGEVRVSVNWLGPPAVLATRPCALSARRLERLVKRQGWRRSGLVRTLSHGIAPPAVDYERGRALVGGEYDERQCLTDLRFSVAADPRAD